VGTQSAEARAVAAQTRAAMEELERARIAAKSAQDATRAEAEERVRSLERRLAELARQQRVVIREAVPVALTAHRGDPYDVGLTLLQGRSFERAITSFDSVIAAKGARADAALYWKAFASFRLGRTDDALQALAALRRDFPQSRYLSDAKVLEADARARAGQPVDPVRTDDDEIKLLAIQGLGRSEQAIPLLEGVLRATNSLAVKRRAIYVLALSEDPRARDILLRYAKGAGTPDLQDEALRYLMSRRNDATLGPTLREIYFSTDDVSTRRTIVRSLATANAIDDLVALARKETNLEVKTEIVRHLAAAAPKSKAAADYLMEVIR
jgi:tetratricopeptide (TPR) repeat protein